MGLHERAQRPSHPVFDPERDAEWALRVAGGDVLLAIRRLEALAGPRAPEGNGWLRAARWIRERHGL